MLAVLVGGYFLSSVSDGEVIDPMRWFWVWVSALVAVDVFNMLLLWRKSSRAGEPFLSAGMKHALFAVVPPLIAGGFISYEFVRADDLENCVLTWVLCYGAALMAMTHFAPRSLRRLGIAFLLSGAIIFAIWGQFGSAMEARLGLDENVGAAAWIMILTFGCLHLAYGLVVMLRGEREEQSA